MDIFRLLFGGDLTSVLTTLGGYVLAPIVAYIVMLVPGLTASSTLTQMVALLVGFLVAGLGRLTNTKV